MLYPSKFYGLEYIESENIVTSVNNVYLNGVRIAAVAENGALAYYLTDQVDSVSHVLDDDANTLSKMQYQPYGETFVHKGDTDFAPKYNSQELDRESGFYFYNARYYDPGIARFTSADTVIDGEWDTQGWNRFSYVKGNPIGAKDPSGHEVPLTGYGSPREGLLPGNRNPGETRYQSEIANKYNLNDKSKVEAAAKEYQAGSQKGFNRGYSRTSGWASPTQGHNSQSSGQDLEKSDLAGRSKAYKDGYNDSVGYGRAYGIIGGLGTGVAEAAGLATAGGIGKTRSSKTPTSEKTISAPEGWITKSSKKGDGIVFQDPKNPHNTIREMPGNPKSPNPSQQNPYVKFMKNGIFYDANGKALKSGKLIVSLKFRTNENLRRALLTRSSHEL
nr:RHS repeat-associated core domain-containing protein [Leptospira adleri]